MHTILRQKTEGINQDLVAFAQTLVRTPSVGLGEGDAAWQVESMMQSLSYDKVFRDESGNVVGVLFGRESEPTVLLNSHLDTVPPGDWDSWDGSPYSGRIKDGRLHGLGAADCKSGVAAQVFAGALLKRSLLPLRGNLIVAATVAEENGRSVGVRALLEQTLPALEMKPTWAILGEPTELGLYYGHDGWLEMEIRVEGANPFQVNDAADAILDDLRDAHQRVRITEPPESIAIYQPRFEDENGFRRAMIQVNRRLKLAEEVGQVLSQLKHSAHQVAQSLGNVAVDVVVRQEHQRLYTGRTTMVQHVTHAWSTDPFHPFIDTARGALAAAGCEARPGKWRLGRLGMGTAGSYLVGEKQIPTIGYGPGSEEMAHVCGESVEIKKLTEAAYGTAAIVHSLIGMPVFGWTADEI